jgi:hypothetical protein
MNKPDWKDAPEWADRLMQQGKRDYYWCNEKKYSLGTGGKISRQFGGICSFSISDFTLVELRSDPCAEGEERIENIVRNSGEGEHYDELPELDEFLGTENEQSTASVDGIDGTLKERGTRYGEFSGVADTTQAIKNIIANGKSSMKLNPYQLEALDMIASKIARIANGDPDYIDNWHDIAGYARLVEVELEKLD